MFIYLLLSDILIKKNRLEKIVPDISSRYHTVQEKIRRAAQEAGRSPDGIRLVAVSKTYGVNEIREAMDAGGTLFGESRVQEAREKIRALGREALQWHMIGHLQQNKVKYIFGLFDLVHSVDSLALAGEIHRLGAARNRGMDILIQVNVAGDQAKFGLSPDNALDAVKEISRLKNVSIRGLMTIPPFNEDPEASRGCYKSLRELRDYIATKGFDLKELSMGMSHDYGVAIEEGATLVRVGSAIFGERTYV